MTVAALALWAAASRMFVSTDLVLALLASGPLLFTGVLRENAVRGAWPIRWPLSSPIVCALWAGALYASGLGNAAARDFAAHLTAKTEVAVDSAQRLAWSGDNITVGPLPASYATTATRTCGCST